MRFVLLRLLPDDRYRTVEKIIREKHRLILNYRAVKSSMPEEAKCMRDDAIGGIERLAPQRTNEHT
jgi:hypothetical protein